MKVKDLWLALTVAVVISEFFTGYNLYSHLSIMFFILFFYLSWICELLRRDT